MSNFPFDYFSRFISLFQGQGLHRLNMQLQKSVLYLILPYNALQRFSLFLNVIKLFTWLISNKPRYQQGCYCQQQGSYMREFPFFDTLPIHFKSLASQNHFFPVMRLELKCGIMSLVYVDLLRDLFSKIQSFQTTVLCLELK